MVDISALNKEVSTLPSTTKATDSKLCLNEWKKYIDSLLHQISSLTTKEASVMMISEQNWQDRWQLKSCESVGLEIKIGDICFIEFGKAFVYEAGYQHFGIVMGICNGKAFVIPMTSNHATYIQAYDPISFPNGKKHLMRIGLIDGLTKPSVLFLNDAKYINTARIINVMAHIDVESTMFKEISKRMLECIFYNT